MGGNVSLIDGHIDEPKKRYIDADELVKDIIQYFDTLINEKADWIEPNLVNIKNAVLRILDKQPTADVEEVKHGYWFEVDSDVGWELVRCSVCGKEYSLCEGEDRTDYCPNCGAKMDGERK